MSQPNTLQAPSMRDTNTRVPSGDVVERWVGLSAMAVVMVAGFAAVLL